MKKFKEIRVVQGISQADLDEKTKVFLDDCWDLVGPPAVEVIYVNQYGTYCEPAYGIRRELFAQIIATI